MDKHKQSFRVLDIKKLSNLRVIGSIHKICYPTTREELQQALLYAKEKGRIPYILGGGSNTLIGHLDKIMLVNDLLMPFNRKKENQGYIYSSNHYINNIIKHAAYKGFGGLEFLAGLPAHLGGLVFMNASAYGKSISNYVKWITVIDEQGEKTLYHDDIEWGYRHTNITGFISSVCLKFDKNPSVDEGIASIEKAIQIRKEKHPMDVPSLGCFFKNPPSIPAGKLIDEAGLKGLQIGGAKVSEKHANFLINVGKATFEDFITLKDTIKDTVKQKFNIELQEEVKILNG